MGNLIVIAVTVAPYYLYVKMYAFKSMAIIKDSRGKLVWRTVKTFAVHKAGNKLASIAIEYGIDNNLVYFSGLIQGGKVLLTERKILEKHYGSKLSDLIS